MVIVARREEKLSEVLLSMINDHRMRKMIFVILNSYNRWSSDDISIYQYDNKVLYNHLQVAADITKCGGKAFYRQVDVTDKTQVSTEGGNQNENKNAGRKTREKIKTRDLLFLNKDFLARWLLSGHGWKRKLARQLFWWILKKQHQ